MTHLSPELPPTDPVAFAQRGGVTLRSYQAAAARAVVESVMGGLGRSLAVMFPRQSGKNEAQAWIEACLLWTLRDQAAEIVKISPTFRPQSLNAMRRLERVLRQHDQTRAAWKKESGYCYRLGAARMYFLSGAEGSNIVGATASTLLEVDEAQDVGIEKFDREISPMAASTRATRVFWGTAWTADTLLARELRAAQVQGGAWVVRADEVGRESPAYQAYVAEQVARLGRSHPLVRTQYFCEELEMGGRAMFPPERLERMRGPAPASLPGLFAVLVDVGGEDGGAWTVKAGQWVQGALGGSDHDSTAVTVVAVDPSRVDDPLVRAPLYRPVERRVWRGVRHSDLLDELRSLVQHYKAQRVVVDATGVGAGLASFLERSFPGRVLPFVFSQASKSKLGWDFLAVVDGGRWQEPPAAPGEAPEQERWRSLFWRQLAFCEVEVLPGPGQVMRWGVPEGKRDPLNGQVLHDDLVISAALCSLLDRERWIRPAAPLIIRASDPLQEMQGF